MTKFFKDLKWIVLAGACCVALVVFLVVHRLRQPIMVIGAVTVQDADFRKQLPIADVDVTVANGRANGPAKSDASGFFTLRLRKWVSKRQPIVLKFRHAGYQPLDLHEIADGKLYVARMVPVATKADSAPKVAIGNVRIRYSIKGARMLNVGSAAETFEAKNEGNVPCNGQLPCSPDSRWKAAVGSVSLDAGPGNQFRGVRVSCIAGPCPFTKIESEDFSSPSQTITASARTWSDTATFLVEAEVVRLMQGDIAHQSYPVIFGPGLSFTLPTQAEGVSLEAEVSGETVIFPLSPDPFLSWANCDSRPDQDKGRIYRCILKPGYVFR